MSSVLQPAKETAILGLLTVDGLVWVGDDVVTIGWDVRTVPLGPEGASATVHGFAVEHADGTVDFVPGHRIRRIFRAETPGNPR